MVENLIQRNIRTILIISQLYAFYWSWLTAPPCISQSIDLRDKCLILIFLWIKFSTKLKKIYLNLDTFEFYHNSWHFTGGIPGEINQCFNHYSPKLMKNGDPVAFWEQKMKKFTKNFFGPFLDHFWTKICGNLSIHQEFSLRSQWP